MAGICLAYLNMNLWDFYDYTPLEIDYALKAYHEKELGDIKLQWEIARTQIYYNYLLTPSRKHKVSYESFKRNYLKFGFDTDINANEMTEEEYEQTVEVVQNIINKNKGAQ